MLHFGVIKSFKNKGLAELFERGRSRRVRQDLQMRCLRRLEALSGRVVDGLERARVHSTAFMDSPNATACTSMTLGVLLSSGKTMMRCESILSNIIEMKS